MDTFLTMLTGAGAFRFALQPLMSTWRGIRDGRNDQQAGRSPYLARLCTQSNRKQSLLDGLRTIWPVMLLAVVLDIYYQSQLFNQVNLAITLQVTLMLACVPYSLARGLSNRLLTRRLA